MVLLDVKPERRNSEELRVWIWLRVLHIKQPLLGKAVFISFHAMAIAFVV